MHSGQLRRVAVTGYGGICSLGNDINQIWQSILDYRLGYRAVSFSNPRITTRFLGKIDPDPDFHRIPKSIRKYLPRFAQLGMIAANEAISMAFQDDPLDPFHAALSRGVIFGTGWGGADEIVNMQADYQRSGYSSPFASMLGMHNVATAAISMHWGFKGPQNTPIAACAASAIAIGDAFESIRHGRASLMLAGGAESTLSESAIWGIDVIQALSKEQHRTEYACCPFSLDRTGFVLAEGAAVLCLEDWALAQVRGAKILGEIVGYGSYSDAFDMSAPSSDHSPRLACMDRACSKAGILPEAVGYINAHGTSTPLNDLSETECIKAAFGKTAYRIPVSSTKSYTGHLIGAAGALESIFCLKALETGTIPATANLWRPDPACDLDYVPHQHRQNSELEYALNLNYGFGGANSALLFRKAR